EVSSSISVIRPTANQVRYHFPPLAKPSSRGCSVREAKNDSRRTLSQKRTRTVMRARARGPPFARVTTGEPMAASSGESAKPCGRTRSRRQCARQVLGAKADERAQRRGRQQLLQAGEAPRAPQPRLTQRHGMER